MFRRHVHFKAVLTRIARACQARRRAGNVAVLEVIVGDRGEGNFGQLLESFERAGSLHGDLRIARTGIFHRAIELVVGGNVLKIFILIRRINAQEIVIVGDLVDQNIVDEAAMFVKQPRILRLADGKERRIIGSDPVHQLQGFRSLDLDLTRCG